VTRVVAALLVAAPPVLAAQEGPLRILGFRRQPSAGDVELVLACSGPVAFRYSSPTLETIRLVLPGLDPSGVTPPREAWGADVAEVELAPATGDEAPGALLVLTLPEFRPYSIRAVGGELRIALEGGGEVAPLIRNPTVEPPPVPLPTPDPVPEPVPEAEAEPVDETPEPASEPDASTATDAGAPDTTPPPPIEPDFFENPVPEPPAEVEPAAVDAADPPAEPTAPAADPLPEPDAPVATRVFEVAFTDDEGGLAIRIPANGRLAYQAFFTEEGPLRMVLDLEGTESRPLFQRLDVGVGPVKRVRVGQHQAEPIPVVRVVIELEERVAHRFEADAGGLTIHFDGVAVEP